MWIQLCQIVKHANINNKSTLFCIKSIDTYNSTLIHNFLMFLNLSLFFIFFHYFLLSLFHLLCKFLFYLYLLQFIFVLICCSYLGSYSVIYRFPTRDSLRQHPESLSWVVEFLRAKISLEMLLTCKRGSIPCFLATK